MEESSKHQRPLDNAKINLTLQKDVDYWTGHFGVSYTKLLETVNRIGHSASKVREDLKKR